MADQHFDRWQFEKPDKMAVQRSVAAFRSGGDMFDGLSINRAMGLDFTDMQGMQMRRLKSRTHRDAAWAKDEKKVLRLLGRVFPHIFKQGRRPVHERGGFHSCARWLEVIRLYFAYGWTQSDVSAQLSCTPKAVNNIVYRVRKARRGMSAHGNRVRRGI